MKKITLLFVIIVFNFITNAQNLVPNPSFELNNNCPDHRGEFYCKLLDTIFYNPPTCIYWGVSSRYFDSTLLGWSSYRETPDYFNVCAPNPEQGVPSNFAGYQSAFEGRAYIGLATYDFPRSGDYFEFDSLGHAIWDSINQNYAMIYDTINFREVIGTKLISNLIMGVKYYVTFWVSRAKQDNPISANDCGAANNNIGMRFSTIDYSDLHPIPLDNFAQIRDTAIITDSINWTMISGSFLADSSYEYLAIGNFFDQFNTDTIDVGPGVGPDNHLAYYYVDQVCVSTDSAYCYNLPNGIKQNSEAQSIKVYPNPFLNTLKIETTTNQPAKIKIFDELSRLVFEKDFVNSIVLNTESFNSGFYYYEVGGRQGLISKGKLFKE